MSRAARGCGSARRTAADKCLTSTAGRSTSALVVTKASDGYLSRRSWSGGIPGAGFTGP